MSHLNDSFDNTADREMARLSEAYQYVVRWPEPPTQVMCGECDNDFEPEDPEEFLCPKCREQADCGIEGHDIVTYTMRDWRETGIAPGTFCENCGFEPPDDYDEPDWEYVLQEQDPTPPHGITRPKEMS